MLDVFIHCVILLCDRFTRIQSFRPITKAEGEKLLYGVSPLKETFHGYNFFGGEEEDGHLRSLSHLLAKAEAGAIGQGDIRHRQVVWPGGPQGVSLGQGAAAVSA